MQPSPLTDRDTVSKMAEARRWRRRGCALGLTALVTVAACSGSDDDTSTSAPPDAVSVDEEPGSLFDPVNPEGTAAPVPGTAVVLDDDVIIATEDGQIPPTTTEPPEMATEYPKLSPPEASSAVSLPCCDHVPPIRTKT